MYMYIYIYIYIYNLPTSVISLQVSFFSALGAAAQKTKKVRLAMVNCMVSHLCHFFGIHELGQILLFPPKQEGGGESARFIRARTCISLYACLFFLSLIYSHHSFRLGFICLCMLLFAILILYYSSRKCSKKVVYVVM